MLLKPWETVNHDAIQFHLQGPSQKLCILGELIIAPCTLNADEIWVFLKVPSGGVFDLHGQQLNECCFDYPRFSKTCLSAQKKVFDLFILSSL